MKIDKLKSESGLTAIFWLDLETCKVYAVKSNLSQSEKYGDFLVHKSCHFDSWATIQKRNPKWKNFQYEDYCRGRCVFNLQIEKFIVYVCPLVKGNRIIQQAIVREFCLPKGYKFDFTDEHYILQSF